MQRIVNGIDALPSILKELNVGKLFIVKDASFPFLNIKTQIDEIVHPTVSFDGFTPNPLYEQVCDGVDLFNAEGCDAILAIGGGSSIDVAKCIKLFCKMDKRENYLKQEYKHSDIPLIAIPTTAGTGSESTRNAVIYYNNVKQTVAHDCLTPDFAILEPSVLKTLPLYQKKCTMMDALCQGIESWWSVNHTDESRTYSQKCIELIRDNWEKYIFENDDEAASQIMLAANYGGRAISIAQTTAAHAMSYKITSIYKFPHGHAVAVCLPEIWEYMLTQPDVEINPPFSLDYFRGMMTRMEMQNPVFGDKDAELEVLSTSVNPVRLKNNPVPLSIDVIRSLYEKIILS
ncbi:MAG: phosphonoacetaldehyde reductase [Prevotellaceae bacterium]|nr:phosphonoacetaldehyde reductase [Prevotellaceae bacterium]